MVRFLLVLSVKETLCDVYIVRQESDVAGVLNSLVSDPDTNNRNWRSGAPLFTSGLSKSSFNTGADWDPGFCMKPPPGKSIFHLFS